MATITQKDLDDAKIALDNARLKVDNYRSEIDAAGKTVEQTSEIRNRLLQEFYNATHNYTGLKLRKQEQDAPSEDSE